MWHISIVEKNSGEQDLLTSSIQIQQNGQEAYGLLQTGSTSNKKYHIVVVVISVSQRAKSTLVFLLL